MPRQNGAFARRDAPRLNQPSPCGCRLSSLRLHAAVTYIAKHSSANGKNPKYPGIGISKIFHCWNMGKM